MNIYLDYAATTPLSARVKKVIGDNLDVFGNPSSLHQLGVVSEKLIKTARREICDVLDVNERELIFTSGGTESNNLAIFGSVNGKNKGRYITSKIEHPSVLKAFESLAKNGHDVVFLSVNEFGQIDLDALNDALSVDTVLVSIMFVNNETGAIQPIEKIGRLIDQFNKANKTTIKFHVDAVQAFGKLSISVDNSHIDLMSISAHKINGLKGTGALYVRSGTTLKPILYGGQQEYALRPGTENFIGILSFAEATKDAYESMQRRYSQVESIKEAFVSSFETSEEIAVNGRLDFEHSPYILNISFKGVKAEVLLHTLEMKGIYVATGSACSSKKKEYSHVLKAIGLDDERLESAIRFSFSADLSIEDIKLAASEIEKVSRELRQIMHRSGKSKQTGKDRKRIK